MISFVHISDPHFAEILTNDVGVLIPRQHGHNFARCMNFSAALMDVRSHSGRAKDDPVNLIISGDLTRTGSQQQFAVAHTFIHSRVLLCREGPYRFSGLQVAPDIFASVPGNHDHWDGQHFAMPGNTPSIKPAHFAPTPWTVTWRDPGSSLALELFGVDTQSGLAGRNKLANGAISVGEFTTLERLLSNSHSASSSGTVRALVCHHPLHKSGTLTETLDDKSAAKLRSIVGQYKIAAVLTGHTHEFHSDKIAGSAHGAIEFGCASTLAHKQAINGFWHHTVEMKNNDVIWNAWRYTLTPHNRRFERAAKPIKVII